MAGREASDHACTAFACGTPPKHCWNAPQTAWSCPRAHGAAKRTGGQGCEAALLAEALVTPRLDEVGVPHRRAEDHDSSLSRWLVPAPHILPQLRDPRWRRAGLRSEDAHLAAEVRCDAAVVLYGVRSYVESLPRTIGCRHDVKVVQEGQQRIVWVQGGCRAVQRFVLFFFFPRTFFRLPSSP